MSFLSGTRLSRVRKSGYGVSFPSFGVIDSFLLTSKLQLLPLLTKFVDGTLLLLPIVREFTFCAFVTERLDFAIRELGSQGRLEDTVAGAEQLCSCNEAEGDSFNSF